MGAPQLIALTGEQHATKLVHQHLHNHGYQTVWATTQAQKHITDLNPLLTPNVRANTLIDDWGWQTALTHPTCGQELRRLINNYQNSLDNTQLLTSVQTEIGVHQTLGATHMVFPNIDHPNTVAALQQAGTQVWWCTTNPTKPPPHPVDETIITNNQHPETLTRLLSRLLLPHIN